MISGSNQANTPHGPITKLILSTTDFETKNCLRNSNEQNRQ